MEQGAIETGRTLRPIWWWLRAAAYVYAASVIGAAVPFLGSGVCTQYGTGIWWLAAAPLFGAFGLFVIFALLFAAVRDGSLASIAIALISVALALVMAGLAIAALRGENSRLWGGIFLILVGLVSLVASFFFCASLSV